MLKIVAVCGNGMGTSMIIKMKVQNILKKLNIEASIDAVSVGEASGVTAFADVIICSKHLVDRIPKNKAKIASVVNLMDEVEIEQALNKVL